MRVFVLSTGRCGSTSFYKACTHLNNYTCGHEVNHNKLPRQRFIYPLNHIEVDNRLSWFTGVLHTYYPDAFYVHLFRDPEEVAESFKKRFSKEESIINGYPRYLINSPPEASQSEVTDHYIHTVTVSILSFLNGKKHIRFPVEKSETLFPMFCERIKATGDIGKACQEFKQQYNRSL